MQASFAFLNFAGAGHARGVAAARGAGFTELRRLLNTGPAVPGVRPARGIDMGYRRQPAQRSSGR